MDNQERALNYMMTQPFMCNSKPCIYNEALYLRVQGAHETHSHKSKFDQVHSTSPACI